MLVKMIRQSDGHKVDVHETMVSDYRKGDYVPVDDLPKDNVKKIDSEPLDIGTDSGDQFSDEQLINAIEAATGKPVHHKTKGSRDALIAKFNELNEG